MCANVCVFFTFFRENAREMSSFYVINNVLKKYPLLWFFQFRRNFWKLSNNRNRHHFLICPFKITLHYPSANFWNGKKSNTIPSRHHVCIQLNVYDEASKNTSKPLKNSTTTIFKKNANAVNDAACFKCKGCPLEKNRSNVLWRVTSPKNVRYKQMKHPKRIPQLKKKSNEFC